MDIKIYDVDIEDAAVCLIEAKTLNDRHISRWNEIYISNDELNNPFLSVEYIRIAASFCANIELALILVREEIVAFFPFQRNTDDRAQAGPAASFIQGRVGLICVPGFSCNPIELLHECGLRRYNLHMFLGSQTFFYLNGVSKEISAQIDLSRGFDAYVDEKRRGGSNVFKSCDNLARRIEREVGPLRFVPRSQDETALQWVFTQKSAQYRRTGLIDIFAMSWVRDIMEKIYATDTPNLAGALSVLYAGDKIIAGHLGMHNRTVWSYNFPAYDIDMAKYSPGLNLLIRMAAYAPTVGLNTIEMGRARHSYKVRLMNKCVDLIEGIIETGS